MHMKNSIIGLVALGALSLTLAACGNNGTSLPQFAPAFATPLPSNPTTPAGVYTQIELLSRPAIKEALQPFNNHKFTNKVEPYAGSPTDPLQADIKATVNLVRPPNAAAKTDFGTALQGILYPNEIAADLSNTTDKASYLGVETGGATGGKFGGRDIADDVINIDLGAVFGSTLVALKVQPEDNEENNCLSQQSPDVKTLQRPNQANTGTFPYLAPPH
ncbi:MAG: hypothetical protein NVS3B7_01650 [Candidatus Elarobacter sp.]